MLPLASRANPNRTAVSIVAVLSLLTAMGSAALDPSRSILQYNIQKWDAMQGLSYPVVRSLCEDAEGSLWFGTSDAGLIMYKGGRFVRFVQREGLPDDSVFQILEDDQGYLRARQAELEKVVELRTAELKSANLALERLAAMDSLTGLANHHTFHEDLDKEWRQKHSSDWPTPPSIVPRPRGETRWSSPKSRTISHPGTSERNFARNI
jgi:ligand-binding sensor domain-containing protein